MQKKIYTEAYVSYVLFRSSGCNQPYIRRLRSNVCALSAAILIATNETTIFILLAGWW